MDTALKQPELEAMLDRAVQDVTEKTAGIRLYLGANPPHGELCTVHVTFKKGFHSSISLCADTSVLERMASSVVRKERISPQDLEDFSKEYLNVLCGRIAALLFQATKIPARFGVPSFHRGRFAPEDHEEQFALNYADGHRGNAQLIHHVPRRREDTDSTPTT